MQDNEETQQLLTVQNTPLALVGDSRELSLFRPLLTVQQPRGGNQSRRYQLQEEL